MKSKFFEKFFLIVEGLGTFRAFLKQKNSKNFDFRLWGDGALVQQKILKNLTMGGKHQRNLRVQALDLLGYKYFRILKEK